MNAKFVYVIMEKYLKDQDNIKQFINVVEKVDVEGRYSDLTDRLKSHRRKRLFRSVVKYAAVVVFVLGLPFLFYKISLEKKTDTIVKTNIIKPLTNDAKLVFEGGKQLSLSSSTDTSVLNKAGLKYDKLSSTIEYIQEGESDDLIPKRIVVPRGAEINVLLSDGTKVYLNSESELEFPKKFVGKYRRVKMSGEAFYKVKKDKEHPFIVETSHVNILVTGTEFNVKAYSEEDNIQTTLVEGGVDVYYGENKENKVSIVPSQQAEFNKKGQQIKVKKVDTELYTAWLGRKFVFKDQTLEDIMIVLARWYDINVFFQNKELKNIVFSAEVNRYDNINTILDCIEETGDIDVRIDDNTVILRKKWR